jgi:glutamate-1-semialdehyde aminotransferase
MPVLTESQALYRRASGLIPAHTQTLAKGPTQFVQGAMPVYLRRGQGARVWDVDGNEYLDYSMAVGPLSLGYAYPAVDEAICFQLEDGITFSLPHPLEVELAEMIHEIVPGADAVRFGKTGAEATSAAVRLARAFTGRDKVLCCGYHGWHDWYIGVTDRAAGVPEAVRDLVFTFEYNDLASVEAALDGDTACVILEPVTFEAPRADFLRQLAALCRSRGALLVFDEMWTGFRLALGGAQEYFGVTADLACFSKAIANGMPLSVLTGRHEVMQLLEKDVFFFSTFGGEALSLAAAMATLREMKRRNAIGHMAALGAALRDGYNAIAAELKMPYTQCIGLDPRTLVTFSAEGTAPLLMKSFVQQELAKRGILWTGVHNVSLSHTEADVDRTIDAYFDVLDELRRAVDSETLAQRIEGEPVAPVFRRTTKFHTKPALPVAGR